MKLETNLSHTPFCMFGQCGRKKIIYFYFQPRPGQWRSSLKTERRELTGVSFKDCRKENTVQLKTGNWWLKNNPAGSAAWLWLPESQGCCVLHHKVHTCVLLKSSSSAPGLSKARGWEAEVRPTEAAGRSLPPFSLVQAFTAPAHLPSTPGKVLGWAPIHNCPFYPGQPWDPDFYFLLMFLFIYYICMCVCVYLFSGFGF